MRLHFACSIDLRSWKRPSGIQSGLLIFALSVLFVSAGTAVHAVPQTTGSLLVLSSHDGVEAPLSELLELRRSQGWRVTLRSAKGTTAGALASVVAEEHARHPAITHVLLVGSDSSLPMERRPAYRIRSDEEKAPVLSDDLYGLPGPNGAPRLAVGRLPADRPAEIRRMAEKTVRYEKEIDRLKSEILLISGREPADTKPVFAGISPQAVLDGVSRALIGEMRAQLPRLQFRVHTTFPGPDHFEFGEGAALLDAGLARRPMMSCYVGHANRYGLATYHGPLREVSITREHVSRLSVREVSGPFVSGGCNILDAEGNGPSIGEVLLRLPGGPVGVVGFTRSNYEFYVMQFLDTWKDQLTTTTKTTLGEMVLVTKRRLATEPQSARSRLVMTLMMSGSETRPDLGPIDYQAAVRKNNALLALYGDPATTVLIP